MLWLNEYTVGIKKKMMNLAFPPLSPCPSWCSVIVWICWTPDPVPVMYRYQIILFAHHCSNQPSSNLWCSCYHSRWAFLEHITVSLFNKWEVLLSSWRLAIFWNKRFNSLRTLCVSVMMWFFFLSNHWSNLSSYIPSFSLSLKVRWMSLEEGGEGTVLW